MQFEQQNPISVMVDQWQWRSPEVAALYANGHKSLLTLRSLMQGQMIDEQMRALRSFEDIHLGCFKNWELAFELMLALSRLSPASGPADEHLISMLAHHMYQHLHYQSVKKRVVAAAAITAALAATPFLLHKLTRALKKN